MQRLARHKIQILNRTLRGLWVLLFFGLACPAFAASFTASLDRTSIVMGEQVVLSLNFEGAKPDEIANPAFDGVQVVSGVSSQTSIVSTPSGQSINYVYTLQLAPTRTGNIVIPAITAKVNGKPVTSQPITLKVAAEDPATTPPAEYADKQVFLWVVLPKTNLYVNEPMVAEIRIYVRSDVRRADNAQIAPAGNGLTFSQLVAGQRYNRRVGNANFSVIPISVAITPVKTGKVSINPINGSIVLNNLDPLERMWGDAANAVRAPLTSPQMDLEISPLPTEGAPPGFNGAVGSYTMAVTAGPTNLIAGDPITLRVQISGHGSLDSISFPEQTNWDNFKVYPPTAKVNVNDQLGLDGTKTFEEIITPQNSDIKSLPAISFSFFNPEEKKYHTLNYPATPLMVHAATPGTMPAATEAHPESARPTADVAPLKQHLGALAQIRPPLVQQPWFLMLQGVPVFALVSCIALRKRRENLANNPRLRRQRQVAQIVREGLQQLQRLAAEKNSDEFFATLFRLLQEQLGERLDLPASAITEAVIDERLRPRGVDSALLASLHELFQTCNLARYAPIKSSQELAAIIPKLESVLNQLRELKV